MKGFTVKKESQVFHACLFEGAFLGFEEEGFSFKEVKDIVHDLSVKGGVVRSGDQDIVHVDKDHVGVLQFKGPEDAIHYALEGGRGIALAK